MLEFHDPRAAKAGEPDAYTLGIDLSWQNSARIACLANGFPDSDRFLQKLRTCSTSNFPTQTFCT